ncbi:hypothetical protein ACTGXS_10930, partial [Streptococcus suis]
MYRALRVDFEKRGLGLVGITVYPLNLDATPDKIPYASRNFWVGYFASIGNLIGEMAKQADSCFHFVAGFP